MNQIEKKLNTVSKVMLFAPPFILLLIGFTIRLKTLDGSQPGVHRLLEIVLAVIFYLPPPVGLILLVITLFIWRSKSKEMTSFRPRNSLIRAGLIIVSPVWLFIIWLFLTGFNR